MRRLSAARDGHTGTGRSNGTGACRDHRLASIGRCPDCGESDHDRGDGAGLTSSDKTRQAMESMLIGVLGIVGVIRVIVVSIASPALAAARGRLQ
jgi:hypothetical protein